MGFREVGKTVGMGAGTGTGTGVAADEARGTLIAGARNRGIQMRALRHDGWTKPRRAQFLRVLGMTCNVRAAAASVGLVPSGAYALRLRDPVFAASWAAALASGYDRLEEALLAAAIAGLNGDWGDEPREAAAGSGAGDDAGSGAAVEIGTSVGDGVARVDSGTGLGIGLSIGLGTGVVRLASMQAVQVGLAMLGRYRAQQADGGKRQKTRRRPATTEETNASIAKKLDALAKRLAVAAAAAAAVPVAGRAGKVVSAGPSGDDGSSSAEGPPGTVAILEKGVRHER